MLGNRRLHILHGRAQVATPNVHIDPARQTRVFTAQHRWAVGDTHIGHVRQHQPLAALGHDGKAAQLLQRIAYFPWVTHIDGEALQTVHHLANVVATHRRADDRLHVGDIQAKTCSGITANIYVYVAPAGQPLSQGAADAGHIFQCAFDLTRQSVNGRQIGTGHLDANRAFDARGQHVNAVADRGYPDVGQARHLDDGVQLIHQFVLCHAGSPLVARLELDGGLKHLHRSWVGSGFCTSRFAVHAGHLGHRLDQAVRLLQQLGSLASRQAGQCGRHVQQVALIQARHKFAAYVLQRPQAQHQCNGCNNQRQLGRAQHHAQQRPVDGNQQAIQRIGFFIGYTPAYQIAH